MSILGQVCVTSFMNGPKNQVILSNFPNTDLNNTTHNLSNCQICETLIILSEKRWCLNFIHDKDLVKSVIFINLIIKLVCLIHSSIMFHKTNAISKQVLMFFRFIKNVASHWPIRIDWQISQNFENYFYNNLFGVWSKS